MHQVTRAFHKGNGAPFTADKIKDPAISETTIGKVFTEVVNIFATRFDVPAGATRTRRARSEVSGAVDTDRGYR
ncbi:hypothetical protein N9B73_10150 [Verrucomicrobiales bacterium]|jgi:hypothetical protein|nr:hypothetical protein [Verrucomicrobiales bacterium]